MCTPIYSPDFNLVIIKAVANASQYGLVCILYSMAVAILWNCIATVIMACVLIDGNVLWVNKTNDMTVRLISEQYIFDDEEK